MKIKTALTKRPQLVAQRYALEIYSLSNRFKNTGWPKFFAGFKILYVFIEIELSLTK